jgi:hypothetical protein
MATTEVVVTKNNLPIFDTHVHYNQNASNLTGGGSTSYRPLWPNRLPMAMRYGFLGLGLTNISNNALQAQIYRAIWRAHLYPWQRHKRSLQLTLEGGAGFFLVEVNSYSQSYW